MGGLEPSYELCLISSVNDPLLASFPILYPVKTPEKLRWGECLPEMGKQVREYSIDSHFLLVSFFIKFEHG